MIRLGRLTIYPLTSAMFGTWQLWTRRWGYISLRLPMPCGIRGYRRATFAFWVSPNATPWGATLIWGDMYKRDKYYSRVRQALWGHGYSLEQHDPQALTRILEDSDAGRNLLEYEHILETCDTPVPYLTGPAQLRYIVDCWRKMPNAP